MPPATHRPLSRTERHRLDRRKAGGVHYTPAALARFLAEEAIKELDTVPSIVLDPACGGGELLEAIWASVPIGSRESVRFIGCDTDPAAVEACTARLAGIDGLSPDIHQADFLQATSPSVLQESLFASGIDLVEAGSVDLAIANPPYVRTQTLGEAKVADLVRRYEIKGRVDLYMAFAFAMTEVLRPGGVMALLCSNRFLTTRGGLSLRTLLTKEFAIGAIFDFGDTRMFEAAVLPAVVIATKKGNRRAARFVSVYRADESIIGAEKFPSVPELAASDQIGLAQVAGTPLRVRRGLLEPDIAPAEPWTLQDEDAIELRGRLASATDLTIGSLVKIRVGIKTTADAVFIRDEWGSLPESVQPEPELLHPLITHHVAERWHAATPRKTILYPHKDRNHRTVPVQLAEYPRAAAYLESHADRLSSRRYVIEGGRQWFEVWVPQKAHLWAQPKVVFPDIAETARFFVDTEGFLVNGDCYWAPTSSLDEALLIAAIGNSHLARAFYDAQCGNQLYAGRRRFMTQYVERFPIPDPASDTGQRIIGLARELHLGHRESEEVEPLLEELIRQSLGFEEAAG
jgi:SAM-dependent methyltransferase